MSIIKNKFIFIFLIIFHFFFNEEETLSKEMEDWLFYYRRGVIQFQNNMNQWAIHSLKLSLKLKPKKIETLNYLGILHTKEKKRDIALKYFLKSVKLNNNQPKIHLEIGKLYEFLLQDEKALKHYKEAYKDDKPNSNSATALSRLLRATGKINQAKALLLKTRNTNLKRSNRLLQVSRTRDTAGKKGKIALLKEAIKINPAHMELYTELSGIYRGRKEYDKAVKILEKGKKIDPDYRPFYVQLGNLYFYRKLRGNTRVYFLNLSERNLREAVKMKPSDEETISTLVALLKFMGRRAEAEALEKTVN